MPVKIFSNRVLSLVTMLGGKYPKYMIPMLHLADKIIGLDKIDYYYQQGAKGDSYYFFSRVLDAFEVKLNVSESDIVKLQGVDPLIITSNHPHGMMDGVIIGALLARAGIKYKFLANYLLHQMPAARDYVIPVDPFGGTGAKDKNTRPLLEALRFIRGNGKLAIFPSGEVAHWTNLKDKKAIESPWITNVGGIIRASKVDVVPVFIEGGNSNFFNFLGLINPTFRTFLLMRETLRLHGATINVRIGDRIPCETIKSFKEDVMLASYLREKTMSLAENAEK
jgi:putative hemolysin